MALQWNASGFSTYSPYAIQVAQTYGIPVDMFLNQISQESEWNTNAVSYAGAQGIAQIEPSTAASPGYGLGAVNPNDPYASIQFMAQYDNAMYSRTGSWPSALAAYNAGLGNQGAGASYANNILGGAWNGLMGLLGGGSAGQMGPQAQAGVAALTGSGGSTPSWLSALTTWVGNAAGSVLFVVLGVVLLVGAIVLIAHDQGWDADAAKLARSIPVE